MFGINKKMYWKGKQVPIKEWIELINNARIEDITQCHVCNVPFKKIDDYTYEPQCNHIKEKLKFTKLMIEQLKKRS